MQTSTHNRKHDQSAERPGRVLTVIKERAARSVIASLLLLVSGVLFADAFHEMMEMRYAAELFHDRRFADAEVVFERLYEQMEKDESSDLHRLSTLVNFLAQTKSFQGKNAEAFVLQQYRLQIATQIFGESSPELGPVLSGLAEAHFGLGNQEFAVKHAAAALAGLQRLGSEHEQHVELVSANIDRYKVGSYDPDDLPDDLSQFYSRCESILAGDSEFSVDSKMGQFVELDVDFNPTGMWGALFSIAAKGRDGEARSGDNHRRIFLPSSDESMHSEVCVVDQRSGVVTSADNSLE